MIRAINLRSGYGDVIALDGVSLHADEGEFVALLGSNGSGKSTLLRTIAGLIPAREGRVLLSGTDVTKWSAEKIAGSHLTLVPEGRGLFPGMSVRDNILMGAYPLKLSRKEISGVVDEALGRFPDLKDRLKVKAGDLSGGQQQMLALAKALAGRPKMLLLDEPSTGLAPLIVKELFEKLDELKSQGLTVLLAEQNAGAALAVANRAYVLENGKITLDGPAGDLAASEDVQRAYLGL